MRDKAAKMTAKMDADGLIRQAVEVRKTILTMIHAAQSGHPGGSLSAADIMTALYFSELNVDPQNPRWDERDRFTGERKLRADAPAVAVLGLVDDALVDLPG